jgi:acetyl-CoA carboxylase, biotin carboxylase subunit
VPIFYDSLISKLVAWAEDRPQCIARMRRALGEYVVAGIRTTVPFFRWLLAQPEFVAGAFHTAYLDEVLARRNGRPFLEPAADALDVAAMAAALQLALGPAPAADASRAPAVAPVSRWKAQARAEGLSES